MQSDRKLTKFEQRQSKYQQNLAPVSNSASQLKANPKPNLSQQTNTLNTGSIFLSFFFSHLAIFIRYCCLVFIDRNSLTFFDWAKDV